MSCTSCSQDPCKCTEARLSLALSQDKLYIIGSLDGVYIKPIPLVSAIKVGETDTALKYDPEKKSLVYENEKYKNNKGSANFITSKQILSGSSIVDLGDVEPYVQGGLASIAEIDEQLVLQFAIPSLVSVEELSSGFITYVEEPLDGNHYKRVAPDTGGESDSVLIGHPNGSIEFTTPIVSPLLVPVANLTSAGKFSGTPAVSSGTWRYQQLGESQIIQNTSGSNIEVKLRFRYSLQTAGTRSGVYASLVNGGSDFQLTFVEGLSNIKQEGYPGGVGEWSVKLEPNQKCQFRFGAWTNASGSMVATIGSVDESAGATIQTVYEPTITIRRLI